MIVFAKIISFLTMRVFGRKTRQRDVSSSQDDHLQVVSSSQIEAGRSSAYRRLLP